MSNIDFVFRGGGYQGCWRGSRAKDLLLTAPPDIPTQVFCSTLDRFAAPDFLLVVERQIQRQGDFLMNNEFTLPVTYPSVTRNLPEATKLPTVTYPQVSRGRAADCSILQPKAKRQSRTQSKKLTGSLSNTQKGGEIYDGSAQKIRFEKKVTNTNRCG